MRSRLVMLSLFVVGACGEDEPPPPPAGNRPPPAAPAGAKPAPGAPGGLQPRIRVEDRVTDPTEKASIRHHFRERDFAVEQSNRDPFQSFVVQQPGMQGNSDSSLPREITKKCRENNSVVGNYSYTDLRLVGIVAERAQRRALMMAGNLGHIIKKGDCVGREKAIVKDVGAGYITFQLQPEELPSGQLRQVEEHSVQLYPNQTPVLTPDYEPPPRTTAPLVAPPSSTPSTGAGQGRAEQPPVVTPPPASK